MVAHIAPEAAVGGPIAAVHEGDMITIDVDQGRLQLEVSEAELRRRMTTWVPPVPRYKTGVFAKYANSVSSAALGAVTTPGAGPENTGERGINISDFAPAGARGR